MKVSNLLLVIACNAGAMHLSSSELVIKDIYLGAELLPVDFDFRNSSDLQSTSGSDEFDTSLGGSLGALYSWSLPGSSSGWMAGGELNLRQQSIGSESDLSGIGFRAIAGYAYAFSDRYTFTFEPFIGYGLSSMTLETTEHIEGFDVDGDYFEYGARVKTMITMSESWRGFISLGYMFTDISMDGGPDDFETELEAEGIYASIGFSWRWNTAPWTLE